jgi:hypothetical protein
LLPEMLNAADTIQDAGVSRNGTPLVRVIGVLDGERYTAVFALRKKRKMLTLQSMWVGSGAPPR